MKFLALVSGGKDSCYAIQQAKEQGHELVAALHMARPTNPTIHEESYMYQTAASEVVRIQVEECLQVPYIQYTRQGTSQHTNLVYYQDETSASTSKTTEQHDEVEDLFKAVSLALEQFPEIEAVCSGAILSTYQRVRVEHVVCERLQLQSLAFLWRAASQRDILQQMLDSGLDAVLVRTAAPPGLLPYKHLNKKLSTLHLALGLFDKLYERYQFHVCGEGGEYETLCVDSPIFHKRLVIDDVQIELDDPSDDTVGNLRVLACHAEEKEDYSMPRKYCTSSSTVSSKSGPKVESKEATQQQHTSVPLLIPRTKRVRGGLLHISEITSPVHVSSDETDEASLAVQEALGVFETLSHALKSHGCTPQDVVMVHLYLSQMSHFASINKHYKAFFGSLLPPSRSCVGVPRGTGQHRVKLDCIVQCGSGQAMRQIDNGTSQQQQKQRRSVLHVQSRSFWAPVCVGPYSQANTLWGCLHYLAGQIGLDPPTMTLKRDPENGNGNNDWKLQLRQIYTNIAQVLDALDQGSLLTNLLSCLVYIQHDKLILPLQDADGDGADVIASTTNEISIDAIESNSGILAGAVDTGRKASTEDLDGFEDEETMREVLAAQGKIAPSQEEEVTLTQIPPILLVSISEMPVGAEIEVEVVASTQKALGSLGRSIHPPVSRRIPLFSPAVTEDFWNWDTGHDDSFSESMKQDVFCSINSFVCTLGRDCAGYAVVTASMLKSTTPSASKSNGNLTHTIVNLDHVVDGMISSLSESLTNAVLSMKHILHVRLYHLEKLGQVVCDQLRCSLESAFGRIRPAVSLVPCFYMNILNGTTEILKSDEIFVAMQVTLIEPTNLETELWIRSDR